ncbi:hypothetical protein ElyMa_002515400 [Elysia marginata]|uniref:Uncharacterized protein n=1 Tax=Elysia marginata TaxID=1093978 RepID=A0AAV4GUD4_9GAST|nr:hypothetical protein ElyMa_002515400 [Elysia marginata]
MASRSSTLELTGILAATDEHQRLRLCLVESLETTPIKHTGGALRTPDFSWARLRTAVPNESKNFHAPYTLSLDGLPDNAGIRGECWATLPLAATRETRERRARILALAEELRGKEVVLTVRPKRYSFVSQAPLNRGEHVAGVSLQFVSLEPRTPSTL